MPRRVNLSQFRSKMRQLQSRQRQAVARYNQGIRKYNQTVRNLKASLNRYNQEVRAYNSRQRLHRQRLRSELARLERQRSTAYSSFRSSVGSLQSTYGRLEAAAAGKSLSQAENFFLDISEREAANSVGLVNALLSPVPEEEDHGDIQATTITDEVAVISEELDARWRGALFSLHPGNPEASRHFCTSAREIFNEILDVSAPDSIVFAAIPECPRTDRGNATRRAKIAYLLLQKGIDLPEAAEFADEDIGNIMDLFEVLNAGTHGASGRFSLHLLASIKQRVEDGLVFLSRLAA